MAATIINAGMVAVERRPSNRINRCMLRGFSRRASSVKVHSSGLVVRPEVLRGPPNNELCCLDVVERRSEITEAKRAWFFHGKEFKQQQRELNIEKSRDSF